VNSLTSTLYVKTAINKKQEYLSKSIKAFLKHKTTFDSDIKINCLIIYINIKKIIFKSVNKLRRTKVILCNIKITK